MTCSILGRSGTEESGATSEVYVFALDHDSEVFLSDLESCASVRGFHADMGVAEEKSAADLGTVNLSADEPHLDRVVPLNRSAMSKTMLSPMSPAFAVMSRLVNSRTVNEEPGPNRSSSVVMFKLSASHAESMILALFSTWPHKVACRSCSPRRSGPPRAIGATQSWTC